MVGQNRTGVYTQLDGGSVPVLPRQGNKDKPIKRNDYTTITRIPLHTPQMTKQDLTQLQSLEISLWKPKTRFDKKYMNKILSPKVFEFGRSGKIYTRKEIINCPPQEIKIHLPLKDFKIHKITKDIILITYISKVQYKKLDISNRSSLWLKTKTGWKLQFHQGTPVNL